MKIHTQPDQLVGLWSNAAAVRHSPHEFTIDFLRCDFDNDGKATQAVLVQRINMSPLFVTQLISALEENWSKYASKAMPSDVLVGFDTSIRPDAPDDSDGGGRDTASSADELDLTDRDPDESNE